MSGRILPTLLLLGCLAWHQPTALASLNCQNGGTYDDLLYMCHCPTNYYGRLCETVFASDDPCDRLSSIPTLTDATGAHRVGNTRECDTDCVDFSSITAGWYKLSSPAGNYFISDYACLNSSINCGSSSPHILTQLKEENNPNRVVLEGKFVKHDGNLNGCYSPTGTALPVRILDCTTVKLYFLMPTLSKKHHYCLGDKKQCAAGLHSSTGFEPCYNTTCIPSLSGSRRFPQMTLDPIRKGSTSRSFRCQVFGDFQATGQNVQYRVQFHLRFHNSTQREISKCGSTDISLASGTSREFECDTTEILLDNENVYGGTVHCSVQAKCSTDLYNSEVLTSNVHRFEFNFRLLDNSTGNEAKYISADRPVQMCINVSDVPAPGLIDFRVAVARQGVIPSDKIALLVGREYRNGTNDCSFQFLGIRGRSQICITLMLNNADLDGWIPGGMTPGQQVSQLKMNISYSSDASGLYTQRVQNGVSITQWVKLYTRQLTVNLSSLYTVDIKTYARAYIDPYVKTAIGSFSTTFRIVGRPVAYYRVLRHRLLPYEVQIAMNRHYTTQVAVRYGYYIIVIDANPTTGAMQYNVKEKLPSGVTKNPLALIDGVPLGVKIHKIGVAVRVRFELYSTVLFVYKFSLPGTAAQCKNSFLMWSADFDTFSCSSQTNLRTGNYDVLELTLTAGFFDTTSLAEGLIFSKRQQAPNYEMKSSSDILLSDSYSMPVMLDTRGEIQPTQLIDLCSCDSETLETATCLLNAQDVVRTRRSVDTAVAKPQFTYISVDSLPNKTISEEEAEATCTSYAAGKSDSISKSVCNSVSSPGSNDTFLSQFLTLCKQHAVTMGTYAYTDSLYSDIFALCYKTVSNDVQQVQSNPQVLKDLESDLCPSNCFGHGTCVSGQCKCSPGYAGQACNVTVASPTNSTVTTSPTSYTVSYYNGNSLLCSTSNCQYTLLSVTPYLSSTDSDCHIQSATSRLNENFMSDSDHLGGSTVRCSLQKVIDWLTQNNRLYMLVKVRLISPSWQSSNHAEVLVYQPQCGSESTSCSTSTKTCHNGTISDEPLVDGNYCLPSSSAQSMEQKVPLVLLLLLLSLLSRLLSLE